MTEMLAAEGSTRDTVAGWRYLLDAERAGQTRLTVGIRVGGSGEEFTVRLRNSIIVVEDGIAGDADATVEATPALLAGKAAAPAAVTLSGDSMAFGELTSLLDREMTGFYMHQR
jgi:alkyl sulfatase BDS1-like metallo-beta-lactamase superfamily hydrolase